MPRNSILFWDTTYVLDKCLLIAHTRLIVYIVSQSLYFFASFYTSIPLAHILFYNNITSSQRLSQHTLSLSLSVFLVDTVLEISSLTFIKLYWDCSLPTRRVGVENFRKMQNMKIWLIRFSVTRLLHYLFNIWAFTTMKICPNNCQIKLKMFRKTLSKWPKLFNVVPKCKISPNLVTLLIRFNVNAAAQV